MANSKFKSLLIKMFPHIVYFVLITFPAYAGLTMITDGDTTKGMLTLFASVFWLFMYAWRGSFPYRYLLPSVLAFMFFVVLPLAYTIYLGFTNYSGTNFKSKHEVKEHFATELRTDMASKLKFQLYRAYGYNKYRILLSAPEKDDASKETLYVSTSFLMPSKEAVDTIDATTIQIDTEEHGPKGKPLTTKDLIKVRTGLKLVNLILPDERIANTISFTDCAPKVPAWDYNSEKDCFINTLDGSIITGNDERGFYCNEKDQTVGPGYRTFIGFKNFKQVFTMPTIRNSFMTIFIWTLMFSFLSVFFSFVVAFLLASTLSWEAVRCKALWRSLLLLPYAVPAFISILIFRGLFNPDQGEINLVLEFLFGIRPLWTTNIGLARGMIIFVNVWLSYPFLFILITGLLHSVPLEVYEASAIDGGGPISNVFRITIPLILRPLTPILILVYALQFNNYLLIHLLTSGNPAIPGAGSFEGYTDILVTFVYKIAFMDSGNYYGLASAIGTLIFIVIAIFSYINLKLFHKHDDQLY